MSFFRITEDKALDYTGYIGASHTWGLPGVRNCPACNATWGTNTKAYPSVDLTPVASLADFEKARAESIEEYEKMRELVRPYLPPGAVVEPGSAFGPVVGNAQGRFGQLAATNPWWLFVQRGAYEKLQAEGLCGLKGCRTALRFRQRASPELLELELLPVGRAHPDCLPPNRQPRCPRCGRFGLTLPKPLLLDATTLPHDLDLFRLEDFSTVMVCTERFVAACQRLGLDGVSFQPLPTR